MAFGGYDSSSNEIHSSLRPFTPPAALISSKAIVAPARLPVPKIAAGPVRLPRIPSLISLSVTPTSAALVVETGSRRSDAETIKLKIDATLAFLTKRQEASRSDMGDFHFSKSGKNS